MDAEPTRLLVVGIDFGTTYSGYAFSWRHDYEQDPLKISANTAWHSTSGQSMMSLKTPTTVLLNPDQTLHSFGFDAEDKYIELAENDEHKEWYYFRRFKMLLYKKLVVNRDIEIDDAMGKPMKGIQVFSLAIRFIKDHFLQLINNRGYRVTEKEVTWVLTVPAIWEEPAKQFMREAAVMAGLASDQLKLVLEPEAASVLCKMLPLSRNDQKPEARFGPFEAGTRYIVLDVGGGTVDVTVHEVMSDGKLKEISKASGGAWGGTKVDASYDRLLDRMFGPELMEKYKREEKIEDLEMQRNFELKKREIRPNMAEMKITIPASLLEFVRDNTEPTQTAKECVQATMGDDITLLRNHLKIKGHIMKDMFKTSIEGIIGHVKKLLSDPKVGKIDKILIVGGFSECPLITQAVRDEFPEVVTPPEAGLAVLKGAVLFGHSPQEITSRVSHHTYGYAVSELFDETKHPQENREEQDGMVYCRDTFDKLFTSGEEVGNDATITRTYQVRERKSTMEIALYASDEPDPVVVTQGCTKIGSIEIKPPIGGWRKNSSLNVQLGIGGSEFTIKVIEELTQNEYNATFDFLSGN